MKAKHLNQFYKNVAYSLYKLGFQQKDLETKEFKIVYAKVTPEQKTTYETIWVEGIGNACDLFSTYCDMAYSIRIGYIELYHKSKKLTRMNFRHKYPELNYLIK